MLNNFLIQSNNLIALNYLLNDGFKGDIAKVYL
jgi:hypothetical protein